MATHKFFSQALKLILLVSLHVCVAKAADGDVLPTKVFYAGIAYLGSYEFIEQNYPHTLELNKAETAGPGRLDTALKELLRQRPPQQFQLEYGLANLNDSESIVMAVAIDKELVSLERLGNENLQKVIVEASAQILFYDFDGMSLIANYPVAFAVNHVLSLDLDPAQMDGEISRLFEGLYLSNEGVNGFISQISEQITSLEVAQVRGFRFQLRQVDSSDEVKALIPQGLSAARFEQYVGQFFSARLSDKFAAPVLPFIKDYALGNQMSGRLANGEVFSLQFPEPDFVFDIKIDRLAKDQDSQGLIYGSMISFGFYENALNRKLAQDDYRYGVYKLDSGESNQLIDWSAYEDSLENLLTEIIEQFHAPQQEWFKKHARDAGNSYDNYRDNKDLFNEYVRQ